MIDKIEYALTYNDFQHIMQAKQETRRLKGWKRILVRTLVVVSVMLIASGSWQAVVADPLAKGAVLLAAYVLFALVLVLAFDLLIKHVLYRMIFSRQKSRIKNIELRFDNDRLNWSTAGGAGHLDWSSFEQPVEPRGEQADTLVLFFNRMQAFVVPRRVFATDQEFEETRHFILSRIKTARRADEVSD